MQPETLALAQPVAASAEEAVVHELCEAVGRRKYENWFQGKTRLIVGEEEVRLGIANAFLLTWLQKHFRTAVVEAVRTVFGREIPVYFEVDATLAEVSALDGIVSLPVAVLAKSSRAAQSPSETSSETASESDSGPEAVHRRGPQPGRAEAQSEGMESFTARRGRRFADLSEMLEGDCNRLALTAARQVCQSPTAQFNPLFIHGPVGTGKTHLLEGIYGQVRRRFPALQVTYLTSEAFTNSFTQALREHTLPSFRQRFRSVDILLLDDIDFLDSKRVIQEEFLHTFKQLESHGRQMVIASDRHPRLLTKISDELRTRFLSGMVCRLEPPGFETRRLIVDRKASRLSAEFTAEALDFVAQRFKNNVRELEGALHCLQTHHQMNGKRITLTAARQALAELERDCIKVVRLTDVEQVICDLFRLQAEDLKSGNRSRALSQPRMLAMFLARKHTRAAYSEIGRYFGGRNHSTVMSAEKKIEGWLSTSATIEVASQSWPLADIMETLEQQLQAG